MKRVEMADIKNLYEYERVREEMRASIIQLKRRRRVSVGDNITLLFENRDTVLFQIQEMIRTERIVDDLKVQDEIDAYNALLPGEGELSATLFIEIEDLHLMSQEEVRAAVNAFQGLDQGCVRLVIGDKESLARFEGGHSKEEKMAAVQYIRFPIPPAASRELLDEGIAAGIRVEHRAYRASVELSPELRRELVSDLKP